jgi:hypothetical protein
MSEADIIKNANEAARELVTAANRRTGHNYWDHPKSR